MKKTTTICIDTEILKKAKIKCIELDMSFARYLEALIEENLGKQKEKEE